MSISQSRQEFYRRRELGQCHKKVERLKQELEQTENRIEELLSRPVDQTSPKHVKSNDDNIERLDKQLILNTLDCIQLKHDCTTQVYTLINSTVFKYTASALSEAMVRGKIYEKKKQACLLGTRVLRHLFHVAEGMATDYPELYAQCFQELDWHNSQDTLSGHDKRGTGIVARSDKALELLNEAITTARSQFESQLTETPATPPLTGVKRKLS